MKLASLLTFPLLWALPLSAQRQHALLIGINEYTPPAGYSPSTTTGRLDFRNLAGCVNDANAMRAVMVAKYGFTPADIDTLYDNAATRASILDAMGTLLQKCSKGDIAFLFYAGHGSQVRNSLSSEPSRLDQTIVPCDTWKEGIRDIRDKELSAMFNSFVDKGVKLTVVFDCCHSASISRGPNTSPDRLRFMPMADWDAKDPTTLQVPEDRKGGLFLIFSASQSDEFAAEQTDDNGVAHGSFTLALIEAMNQQSVDASARDLFTSARAILKSNGKKQEPVIGGSQERQRQTLFGRDRGSLADYTSVAVTGTSGNKVELQGGFAIGLLKGNELAMTGQRGDTVFKLKVDTVLGITRALATVITGSIRDIRPGYQFRVTNWVSSGRPFIKIHIPDTTVSDAEEARFASIARELKASRKIRWVDDLGKGTQSPYVSIFWSGKRCFAKVDRAPAREVRGVTAAAILDLCKKDSTLYVEVPVSQEKADGIRKALASNRGLMVVPQAGSANYTLFGKLGGNGIPAYGLRKVEMDVRDSLESMPAVTGCFETRPKTVSGSMDLADSLLSTAMKLSKIKGWLELDAPDAARNAFPFHLEAYDEDAKKTLTDMHYAVGRNVSIRLVGDSDLNRARLSARYVYVFGIDQSGAMYLLFPSDGSNVNNKFPIYNKDTLVQELNLTGTYAVPAPSGTDNFFVLSTTEPIQGADMVFNQEGVYSKGARSNANQVADLLDMGNIGGRGAPPRLPATWTLRKYAFKCTY